MGFARQVLKSSEVLVVSKCRYPRRSVPVPFLDLRRQTQAVGANLPDAVDRVISSGHYLLGHELELFEQQFALWAGSAAAVGVATGTDAIELSLRALGIGLGDEVVTQATTCVPTVAAIERAGATPVLCDVDLSTGSLDPESLEGAIGAKTRAIIPVHLYGQCANLQAVAAAAGEIPVIEDCAQAHGTTLDGRRAGSIGQLGAFSFYPTKNLGALGDGGAVVTDDEELANRLRQLRCYGQSERYCHELAGVNSRLDEIQAAVLRTKLPLLDGWIARRRAIAQRYTEAFEDSPLSLLPPRPGTEHSFHLFVVRASNRDALRTELETRGISTMVHYPLAIHQQPAYRQLANGPVPLHNSERICSEILSLPLFPELTDAEVSEVIEAVSLASANLQPLSAD